MEFLMKSFNVFLLFITFYSLAFSFEPPKNANRAEINCMFISKNFKANGQKMTGSNAK